MTSSGCLAQFSRGIVHEHPPSCCCSGVLEGDRLEQVELFAAHSMLPSHLEGTALG